MSEQLERYRPKYIRDTQLRGLLEQGAQSLGEMALNRFIRAQERFNEDDILAMIDWFRMEDK